MCCTSLQVSDGLKMEERKNVGGKGRMDAGLAAMSWGGGSLGLQSQSDHTGGHGGREGGAWQRAGAAAMGTRGHLSRHSRISARGAGAVIAGTNKQ